MPTDRQKICRCGANVAEFLADIRILERNLRIAKVENSAISIPAFNIVRSPPPSGGGHI